MRSPIEFSLEYTGLQYPIRKVPGSKWVVVGVVGYSQKDIAADPGLTGKALYLEVHYDADDPLFEFLDPKDYPGLSKKTVEKVNLLHRKNMRLRLRRITDAGWLPTTLEVVAKARAKVDAYNEKRR